MSTYTLTVTTDQDLSEILSIIEDNRTLQEISDYPPKPIELNRIQKRNENGEFEEVIYLPFDVLDIFINEIQGADLEEIWQKKGEFYHKHTDERGSYDIFLVPELNEYLDVFEISQALNIETDKYDELLSIGYEDLDGGEEIFITESQKAKIIETVENWPYEPPVKADNQGDLF